MRTDTRGGNASKGSSRRNTRSRFTKRRWLLLGLLAAIVIPILIGIASYILDPEQWRWDDWGGTANSVVLAAIFFLLAWLVNREAEARSTAVANAALLTTVGQLTMTSTRTFGGFDEQALRIATDALSALQHYPLAGESQRSELLAAIADAYTNLSFGSLSRAPVLPRSTWDKILEGAEGVGKRLEELPWSSQPLPSDPHDPGLAMARDPRRVSTHIEFVMNVAKALRRRGTENVKRDCIDASVTIEDLEFLYRHELTVIKDWKVLEDQQGDLECSVKLHDASSIAHWYTPWYIKGDVGKPVPTNVVEHELQETAAWNQIVEDRRLPELPRHPRPLTYAQLPGGFRTSPIGRMADILAKSPLPLVTCLVYELKVDDGGPFCTVVDGNHRVAAARLFSQRSAEKQNPAGENQAPALLLTYLIKEKQPITTHTLTDRGKELWVWHGFTPDIALLRAVIEGRGAATKDEGKAVMVKDHVSDVQVERSGKCCPYCTALSEQPGSSPDSIPK
jgi:hypothetical protein